jgi:hypothetical protein
MLAPKAPRRDLSIKAGEKVLDHALLEPRLQGVAVEQRLRFGSQWRFPLRLSDPEHGLHCPLVVQLRSGCERFVIPGMSFQ